MRHKRDKLPVHTGQPLEMAKLPLGQFTGKGGQTPEKNYILYNPSQRTNQIHM